MKADFSRGFKITCDDGTTETLKIFDSNGDAVSFVNEFDLHIDAQQSLPVIKIAFHPGLQTIRERTKKMMDEDPEFAAKMREMMQQPREAQA